MKKIISILCLTIGLFVSVTAFTACGGDDDNIISSPDSPEAIKAKHITRVEFQRSSGSTVWCIINYDSQGRVSSFIWNEDGSASKYDYTYGESTIVEKSSSGSTTFSLLNGRITSAGEYGFSYDSSDQLQAKNGSRKITYTWQNNNLASYVTTYSGGKNPYTTTLEYSDIKAPTNFIPFLFYWGYKFKLRDSYPFLAYYGYFGKTSQNLAKKLVQTFSDPAGIVDSETEEYEYTIKDGLPVEINVKGDIINGLPYDNSFSTRIIIEWN